MFVFDIHRQRRWLQPGEQKNQKTRSVANVFQRQSVHKILWCR